MSNYIIPTIVLVIIGYGFYKEVNIYDEFILGVREGMKTIINIFPTIFAMSISVNVLINSNIINDLSIYISDFLNVFDCPREVVPLIFMRPVSGNSSLVILDNILKVNGPDSLIGRIASVMQGSTDTTLYIISLYFSSVGIKKIKYSLIVGLLTDLIAAIISIVVVKILFY